jgi:hypothetical protein
MYAVCVYLVRCSGDPVRDSNAARQPVQHNVREFHRAVFIQTMDCSAILVPDEDIHYSESKYDQLVWHF